MVHLGHKALGDQADLVYREETRGLAEDLAEIQEELDQEVLEEEVEAQEDHHHHRHLDQAGTPTGGNLLTPSFSA